MVNLTLLTKKNLGKLVLPEKFFKLKLKKNLEDFSEKIEANKINYLIINYIFFGSSFFSIIFSIIFSQYFLDLIGKFIYENFFFKILFYYIFFVLVFFLFFYFSILLYYSIRSAKFRAIQNEIEKCFPEFLDNLKSELKGGISIEVALLKATRKEHKELLREVTLINEKIFLGIDVIIALREFRERYQSKIISRTLLLIEEGMLGGANLSKSLELISSNLKNVYNLNSEIQANSSGFILIIRTITIIIAPLLFALALTLLNFRFKFVWCAFKQQNSKFYYKRSSKRV